jgi:hypothetical protein
MRLLHVTAHLGGGVGKVLSRLVEESSRTQDGIRHTVACLEALEKTHFAEHLRRSGGQLEICPSEQRLQDLVRQADVVQVEWWHHPAVARWMCAGELPAMRLVVWSHVSGLHAPVIPAAFAAAPHRFLFTSPCSLKHPRLAGLAPDMRSRVDAIFSSGGFGDLPMPPKRPRQGFLRVGYVGTLNFAKLHPGLMDYLAAVDLPDFRLALVGDATTGDELLAKATAAGVADRLELKGYRADVAPELAQFDVLAYLLNPLHYGTTENALLEAMAMGVVPVVLDNPAERELIEHNETGLIVDCPAAFADALRRLATRHDERERLSENAVRSTREKFAVARTASRLSTHYRAVLEEEKRPYDFRPLFGREPADWFRACQGDEAWQFCDDDGDVPDSRFVDNPHFLFEETKSSVLHFHKAFPADARLARWAGRIRTAR